MNPPIPQNRLSRRAVLGASGLALVACGPSGPYVPTVPGEVEATEYQGTPLTPIGEQRGNSLAGTQQIDQRDYRLRVDGPVDTPLTLTYDDLQAYEQQTWLMDMNCVEGWSYAAKWTGPSLPTILADAGVHPDAVVAIFETADQAKGYTSLDLDYLLGNEILLALKLNDITLPPHKGFPVQLVAKHKFGYKWAKWITRIELSADDRFRGYWERAGYSHNADDTGPAFD